MVSKFIRPTKRVFLAALFAILIFSALQFAIHVVMPSASGMVLTLGTDHPDSFQIYYWDGLNRPTFHENRSFSSALVEPQDKVTIPFKMVNAPVRKVRLDTGHLPGVVKLYHLKITSHFSHPVIMSAKDIMEVFVPGKEDVTMQLKNGYVEVTSQNEDPYLLSRKPLLHTNPLLLVGLSIFLSLTAFVFFLETDLYQLAAFKDFRQKGPSTGSNIDALDGLRGLAAIMVVGDHTYGRFTGIGAAGVWIFMALSGFLLARPFIAVPGRVFSLDYMGHFFLRRAQRIIPVYYFYITIVYLLTARFDAAFLHYLFLEGRGHTWVIPQEILFYLMVPLIMGFNFLLFRKNTKIMIFSLVAMIYASNKYLSVDVFSLYGMREQDLRFYLGIFLTGIMFSYLYYAVYSPSNFLKNNQAWLAKVFSGLSLLLLLILLLGSSAKLWGGHHVWAQIYFPWYATAAGLLVFALVAAENRYMTRILSWASLRAIGLVSLSLYLFHPFVLEVLRKGTLHFMEFRMRGVPLFICTLIIGYFVACLSYSYIEKPFH